MAEFTNFKAQRERGSSTISFLPLVEDGFLALVRDGGYLNIKPGSSQFFGLDPLTVEKEFLPFLPISIFKRKPDGKHRRTVEHLPQYPGEISIGDRQGRY